MVIFAVFVVWFEWRRVRSNLVDGSVYIWPSKGQAHIRGRGTGRRAQHNAAVRNKVPILFEIPTLSLPELLDKTFPGVCKSLQVTFTRLVPSLPAIGRQISLSGSRGRMSRSGWPRT